MLVQLEGILDVIIGIIIVIFSFHSKTVFAW